MKLDNSLEPFRAAIEALQRLLREFDDRGVIIGGVGASGGQLVRTLLAQAPVPEGLLALDPGRVIGLTVDPDQLLEYRTHRQLSSFQQIKK